MANCKISPDLASTMAAPPALPFELVEEILLRLPPDEPAWILRASLVCKAWGCAFSHPSFRRRLHELHGTPPVLGFLPSWWIPVIGFLDWPAEHFPSFIPNTASPFSLAAPERRYWRALDCRHGRAVFISEGGGAQRPLLLWEPITGSQRRVPVPAAFAMSPGAGAAVFCAADGCDHHGCHGGSFRVVFVFTDDDDDDDDEDVGDDDDESYVTSVCVYSSETGMWGELASMQCEFMMDFGEFSSVLVGRSQPYFMSNDGVILEYDLESNNLTVIDRPKCDFEEEFNIMLAEDGRLGGLGLIRELDPHLKLWSREVSDGTDARWILSRIIYLYNLLPIDALMYAPVRLCVMGFVEGANVIFIDTHVGLFTIELHSERVSKCRGSKCGPCPFLPVVSFYTPVPQNKHQDQLLSNTGEEERGEKEKTVAQAQKLHDNGSNSIEGTSSTLSNVSAMSWITVARVPPCGDTAPESAGMGALLYEAQEVTDPTNEESVKNSATANKDDTGNLIGGSNVDDASHSDKGD